jgi:hypothetical protein
LDGEAEHGDNVLWDTPELSAFAQAARASYLAGRGCSLFKDTMEGGERKWTGMRWGDVATIGGLRNSSSKPGRKGEDEPAWPVGGGPDLVGAMNSGA